VKGTLVRAMALCLAALVFSFAAVAQTHSANVIFLVRHAEKESQEHDAVLSVQGKKRAECLARVLHDANIQTIYVSEFTRTQQTARPLAQALGITPKIVPASDIETVVSGSLKQPSGVLIVGHSDTIPEIVNKLTGRTVQVADTEYDKLILVVQEDRKRMPVVLRYCEASSVP